jgi:hypothetical protein
MRTFIRHNEAGEILSVSRTDLFPSHLTTPFGDLSPGEAVLEVTGRQGLAELNLEQIHDSYKVSVDTGKLIKRR